MRLPVYGISNRLLLLSQALSDLIDLPTKPPNLSWAHHKLLLQVGHVDERNWEMHRTAFFLFIFILLFLFRNVWIIMYFCGKKGINDRFMPELT